MWTQRKLCRRSSCLACLEALATKHRPALCGLERHCSFALAPGTDRPGFHPLRVTAALRQAKRLGALVLAGLAAFWLIFELLIVEEKLFAGCEDEVGSAIDTLQNLILELHETFPFPNHSKETREDTYPKDLE